MAEKNGKCDELLRSLGFETFEEETKPDKSHYLTFAILELDDFKATFAVDDSGQRWMNENEAIDLTPHGFANILTTQ